MSPGAHLIKHYSQTEDVRSMIDRLSLRLLGREIGDGSHHQPRLGEEPGGEIVRFRRCVLRRLTRKCFRDTKIEHLESLIASDHYVGRFQIPMNYTLLMRRANCI